MFAKRIIPCLDCKNGRVVKGIQFLNLRDAGDPGDLAEAYNREGADELVMLDISASREGRATLMETVHRVARRLFIPLTVGGGVRTLEDAQRLLAAGADKVAVNTAAVEFPEIVNQIAEHFGRQALVVAIDARRSEGAPLMGMRLASAAPRWTSLDLRWNQTNRLGRGSLGSRGRSARGRRNPLDFDGRGWHAGRLRLRINKDHCRSAPYSRDRFRRCRAASNILRRFS